MSQIFLSMPDDQWKPEREWVKRVVFDLWLKLDVEIRYVSPRGECSLSHQDQKLTWPDSFFNPATLPLQDYVAPADFLGKDLLGTAFAVLSRQEEWSSTSKDKHGRFPISASILKDIVTRPVVDEAVAVIENWLRIQGIALRDQPMVRVQPSCDVDIPFDRSFRKGFARWKAVAAHVKAGELAAAKKVLKHSLQTQSEEQDPCWTFPWMLALEEKILSKWDFFFIAADGTESLDGDYRLDEPAIKKLLITLKQNGNRVGLHGSYRSMQDVKKLTEERLRLEQAVGMPVTRIRQHFLRWDVRTPRVMAQAGFKTDCSLGFAQSAGFRTGTARTYPWFDLEQRQELSIQVEPLLVMDTSLNDKRYMGLSRAEQASLTHSIVDQARKYGGTPTVLVHNHLLERTKAKNFWQEQLDR